MTSQVPSNDNASLFGVMRSRLLLIFLVCTVALTGYTLALQHSSDPIIWWQPDQKVITDGGSSVDRPKLEKFSRTDGTDRPTRPPKPDKKCSPKAAIPLRSQHY